MTDTAKHTFAIGDHVEKIGGDYTFVGTVVAAFPKLSGAERFVVEDDRGVLHVYSAKNLRAVAVTVPNSPSDQYAAGFVDGQRAVWALHKAKIAELKAALEKIAGMIIVTQTFESEEPVSAQELNISLTSIQEMASRALTPKGEA